MALLALSLGYDKVVLCTDDHTYHRSSIGRAIADERALLLPDALERSFHRTMFLRLLRHDAAHNSMAMARAATRVGLSPETWRAHLVGALGVAVSRAQGGSPGHQSAISRLMGRCPGPAPPGSARRTPFLFERGAVRSGLIVSRA